MLAPVFDMFNHSPKQNVKLQRNFETETLDLVAKIDVSSSDELFINYGMANNGNMRSILGYGFTTSRSQLRKDRLYFTDTELAAACSSVMESEGIDISLSECFDTIQTVGHAPDIDGKLFATNPE